MYTCPPVCLRGGKDTLHFPAAQAQGTEHSSGMGTPAAGNEYETGSRWLAGLAGLVSMQIVVLLWRDPLEIVESIVVPVSILVVHLCLLRKPW